MNRLYICERPYPLYRTLIKCVDSDETNDILISNNLDGMEKMYPVLKNEKLFRNVYYYDDQMYKEFNSYGTIREYKRFPVGIFVLLKKLLMYMKLQKKAQNITLPEGLDIDDYDEIYVNDSTSTMMFYLFHKGRKVIWVEHGKNNFQNKKAGLILICYRFMPLLEKLGLAYSLCGMSKYVEAIEVNNNNYDLISLIKKKQIREVDLDQILEKMSAESKLYLFKLYCEAYHIQIDMTKPIYIILTIPLFMEGYVKSEEEQIRIYNNLISKMIGTTENVLIKPHPRDSINYTRYIPGVILGERSMSAEIFNLSGIQFEAVYAIGTSSYAAFTNVKTKKLYSIDELEQFMSW